MRAPNSDTGNYWKHTQLYVSQCSESGLALRRGSRLGKPRREQSDHNCSTACGDSSSGVVTKSNHNQTEKRKCFCHNGGRHTLTNHCSQSNCVSISSHRVWSPRTLTPASVHELRLNLRHLLKCFFLPTQATVRVTRATVSLDPVTLTVAPPSPEPRFSLVWFQNLI